jgi:general secretion pathway protein H
VRRDRNRKDEAGFTLVELLVVVFIIGAASALVGVTLSESMEDLHLKTLTKEISASMRYARSRAVAEKKTYSLVIDAGDRRYGLYTGAVTRRPGADSGGLEMPAWKTVSLRAFPEGISVVNDGGDRVLRIDFSPQGGSTGGKIQIWNRKRVGYRITVERLTGRVEARKS